MRAHPHINGSFRVTSSYINVNLYFGDIVDGKNEIQHISCIRPIVSDQNEQTVYL